jgi:hypothetical protein
MGLEGAERSADWHMNIMRGVVSIVSVYLWELR